MANHPFNPFVVSLGNRPFDHARRKLPSLTAFGYLNSFNYRSQIDTLQRLGRHRPLPQLEHELAHALYRMLDRHQHILLKLRVVAVAFSVAQHERQLRNDVLQIMHHER